MKRFTALTEKTYKILTAQEAYEEFELLQDELADSPSDYFYLKVIDRRPLPVKIPPQLIGPYPNRETAENAVKEATEQQRSGLSRACDNIIDFERKMRE